MGQVHIWIPATPAPVPAQLRPALPVWLPVLLPLPWLCANPCCSPLHMYMGCAQPSMLEGMPSKEEVAEMQKAPVHMDPRC